MSEINFKENIFRFMATRSANLTHKQSRKYNKFRLVRKNEETDFYKRLKSVIGSRDAATKMRTMSESFKNSNAYVLELSDLEFDVTKLFNWMLLNHRKTVEEGNLKTEIKALYDMTLPNILSSSKYKKAYVNLLDSILADSILREHSGSTNDDLITGFKLLILIKLVSSNTLFLNKEETVGTYISHTVIMLPNLSISDDSDSSADGVRLSPQPAPQENNKRLQALKKKLSNLSKAHREFSLMATEDVHRKSHQEEEELPDDSTQQRAVFADRRDIDIDDEDAEGEIDSIQSQFILSSRAVGMLSQTSLEVVEELKLSRERINPIKMVKRIENEMKYISGQLSADVTPRKLIVFGGMYLEAEKFKDSLGQVGSGSLQVAPEFELLKSSCMHEVGIGDLLIVRQKLKAYELADFAHVENVLAGEKREREHRRLNVREDITTREEETETEIERDLQSTQRNEMQSEAEKTVKDEFRMDAGLQLSGSYGPSISFSSSLNAGFSTSTEETQKKASSYSKEVTEKTSERISERIREEWKRRILEEIEETNRHSVNNENAANGHVRGIYRWLNKIYDAQVFNYGQRMMYEFVIPEPAAYFLYALVENPPEDMELLKPEEPKFNGAPLKPINLSRDNYHDYVAQYGVTNAPEPPSHFSVVSHTEKQEGKEENHYARGTILKIPTGYEAVGAVTSVSYVYSSSSKGSLTVMVGGWRKKYKPKSGGIRAKNFDHWFRNEISVNIVSRRYKTFGVGIDVFCTLTSEAYEKWQLAVYEAIMHAYFQQKAEYEEKLAALGIQEGIQILGRNPLENQRIQHEEIKKLAIMMMQGTNNIAQHSFLNTMEPYMNIKKACKSGSWIKFFENAFEWNNMLYVYYPYFWGRKAKWISALHLTDPDPDFAAFLKAGAVRVQLPVRPGFERAVAHYAQYGKIWQGNDVPLMDDDLYVPIIDEITENLGKLEEGVPYPEGSQPWEVTLPTSLTLVQNLDEIPGIRDTLTDQTVNIQS